MKKRVFICSPLKPNPLHFTTLEGNIQQAKGICQLACQLGVAPFAPHVFYTQFLDDTVASDRLCGLECGLEYLKVCEEIWVYGNVISEGMQKEINLANSLGITVKYCKIAHDYVLPQSQNLVPRLLFGSLPF